MNNSSPILYTAASTEDLPAVVELCMAVEAQHESYWPLRWGRRPGLSEGYLGWLNRRLSDPRMLIHVAKDPALPGPRDLFGEGGAVVGMILVTIEKEIPIYTYSEKAYVQDLAVRDSHRRRRISQPPPQRRRQLGQTPRPHPTPPHGRQPEP